MSQRDKQVTANAQERYEVTAADLPLVCPMDSMTKWDSHPQVALAVKDGHAKCPYCGAEYVLTGDMPAGHH